MLPTSSFPFAVSVSHASAVRHLPDHHRDPFDRLLVAQAHVEGLTMVTADQRVMQYQLNVLSAVAG